MAIVLLAQGVPMQIMKFGAVAVSDIARLRALVGIVADARGSGKPTIVVCTAITGITDLLIGAARGAAHNDEAAIETARRELWGRHRALAERLVHDTWERENLYREWADLLRIFDRVTRSIATLGEQSPRGIDAVAALGERFAAHLVATVLRIGGVAARMVDATELIVTDDQFGNARPLPVESSAQLRERLHLLSRSVVPVVTGYIGATREGVVTTLGRGGGDYTAALIGAALTADEVVIWTDVSGILTADPKIVPNARTLAELSYAEAADIAAFGPEVLHPRTIAPVVASGIPLRIANMHQPEHPGTRILANPAPTLHAARAIISTGGLSLLTLVAAADDGWAPNRATHALERLSHAGVEILTFAQVLSERSLTLSVRAADAAFAHDCLLEALATTSARVTPQMSITTPVALVALISASNGERLAPRTLAALGRAGAHVLTLAQSSSSYHISFIIPEAEVYPVVRALHHELGLA